MCPKIDEAVFHHNADWKDFYGDIEEELPAQMPELLGNPVTISAFVDANYAGNVVMRIAHWCQYLCSECINCLVFQEAKYRGVCIIW